MQLVAVLVGEQVFCHQAVLELRRQCPFARHHVVARQVPPEVVVLLLLAAVDFPAPEHLEGLAVHDEDAGQPVGAVLAGAAERADIDPFRAAMHGVRPRVAGLADDLVRLDDLVDARLRGMRLGVDDIDARRAHARDDQVAPLQERVAGQRRQRGGTGIPAEVMQFVALVGHRHGMHHRAVGGRAGLDVDHGQRVGARAVGAQQQGVGKFFRRRAHRELGRRVKRGIRPHVHG
ncbi:hypothetical protein D3C81_1003890 [compost metagenome]